MDLFDDAAKNGEELKNIDTYSVKCQTCGGTMIFDPVSQSLKCDHCGNTVDIQKNHDVKENDVVEGFEKATKWDGDEQGTYKCKNCGAVVVLNKDEHAALCPFCGTSHIVKEGAFKGLKPQVVVPFSVTGEDAEKYAKAWAKKRIFAPSKFKKSLIVENIHGVYEPCFTFDSNVEAYYEGRVGERRTRTVGSGKNRRTETYIVYYHIHGVINKFIDDIYVATNVNFPQAKMEKMMPFRPETACVYENKYLSGFMAESYQKDLKDSWEDAKKMIDKIIRAEIKNRHNYDVVDYINVSATHSDVTYKYVLLPVYFLNYAYKQKSYEVCINGATGKVTGKTPKSPIRIAIAAVLGLAVAAALAVLLYMFYKS